MAPRLQTGIVLLLVTQGLAGCDSPPLRPSPVPGPATTPTLRVFTDSTSGFSTSDVRDAQEQIVQFNSAGELIWTADGTRLPGFPVETSISINADKLCRCWFEVRFGTKDGERRAYLTVDYGHENDGTVVNLEIVSGVLVMAPTIVFPPGSYTLSGVVTEVTPTGQAPLQGASVYRSYGSGWQGVTTDKTGFYEIRGLYDGSRDVVVSKDGYRTLQQVLSTPGDTRFDVRLVRQ